MLGRHYNISLPFVKELFEPYVTKGSWLSLLHRPVVMDALRKLEEHRKSVRFARSDSHEMEDDTDSTL